MRLNLRSWGAAATVCALCLGCGDSGGGSASASNSNSNSQGDSDSATESASEPTDSGNSQSMSATESSPSGSMSDSISGTTGDEGGVSDSQSNGGGSGNETDSMSGGESSTTEMISGGGETSASSTGEPPDETTEDAPPCGDIMNEADCVAAGCKAVQGQQFVSDNAIYCLDSPVFLGCMDDGGCGDALTTVCKGNVKYQLPDTCIPAGFMACQAPPDQGMNGYPEC